LNAKQGKKPNAKPQQKKRGQPKSVNSYEVLRNSYDFLVA
jgi:hypothetical protein